MTTNSRYPDYDVLGAREEWDEHTRQVIAKRMADPPPPQFFTDAEAATMRAALRRLLAEQDPWLIEKVLEHIDEMLAQGKGDGYRPEWQAPPMQLWREGLLHLGAGFANLPPTQQDAALKQLEQTDTEFFRAMLKEAVSAYCSLPPVWSFMGYGGPAYPRGYVRIELGLRDPWEAKPNA